jgi:hypothetical protein
MPANGERIAALQSQIEEQPRTDQESIGAEQLE